LASAVLELLLVGDVALDLLEALHERLAGGVVAVREDRRPEARDLLA
jgi:hypothetical protein